MLVHPWVTKDGSVPMPANMGGLVRVPSDVSAGVGVAVCRSDQAHLQDSTGVTTLYRTLSSTADFRRDVSVNVYSETSSMGEMRAMPQSTSTLLMPPGMPGAGPSLSQSSGSLYAGASPMSTGETIIRSTSTSGK